jgi:hypothetical protein
MPDLDDQNEEVLSSHTSNDDAQQLDLATEQAEGAAADPSSATTGDAEGEDDLLSVVRDVVGDRRETPEPEAAAPPAASEESSEETAGGEDEDEDYSNVPFANHPRFRKLLKKHNQYKAQAQQFSQDAERYNNVQNFMDAQGLGSEEAADLLIIGGLMKTNPVEAWRRARPTIQKLLIAAGEVLPDDLKQRVQAGQLNAESAMAESRARALSNSVQATRSFEQRRNDQLAQSNAQTAIVDAGNAWEAERRQRDPNFEAKLEPFKREMAYIQHQEGRPTSPAMMVDQFKRAYAEVNKKWQAPAPAAAPVRRPAAKPAITPVRGGSVAGKPKPEDESDRDVIRRLAAARAS